MLLNINTLSLSYDVEDAKGSVNETEIRFCLPYELKKLNLICI